MNQEKSEYVNFLNVIFIPDILKVKSQKRKHDMDS